MAINIDYEIDDSKVTELLEDAITKKIKDNFKDNDFLKKVTSIINQQISEKIKEKVAEISFASNVYDVIDDRIEKTLKHYYPGIQNKTNQVQLTLMEDTVVNENEFVTKSLNVIGDAVVNDLIVKGRVNTDNRSWSELSEVIKQKTIKAVETELTSSITESVLTTVTEKGLDIKKIHAEGVDLISNTELGKTIIHSNLERVGALEKLTVVGPTTLTDTVTVTQGRVGVNTERPNMALDIWDGEVEITLGKRKENTGYIGLGRKGTLEIGSSSTAITIDDEGKTKINELMIGRNNIAWSNEVPGFEGKKGDIVFNMNPTTSNAVGWQCLGKFKWRPFN